MEELVKRVQQMLVDEYRREHPELDSYSDEEIALMNPVTDTDIISYITLEKMRIQNGIVDIERMIVGLREDIELSLKRIDDPYTFGTDRTEARRDIVDDNINIARLEKQKEELLQKIAELNELDRQENEKRSR